MVITTYNLHKRGKRLFLICTAWMLVLGVVSPVGSHISLNVISAHAQYAEAPELSASDLQRGKLMDLIEEFDSKISDINAKNPEMAKINSQTYSGGHMNMDTGKMEDKFGRVTPSNTTRNGLFGAGPNSLMRAVLLGALLSNQPNMRPVVPGTNPVVPPAATPTPRQAAVCTATPTPRPTAQTSPTPTCTPAGRSGSDVSKNTIPPLGFGRVAAPSTIADEPLRRAESAFRPARPPIAADPLSSYRF